MKAIVYSEYGPPDVFHLAEVEKPSPTGSQVLVKVQAVSANPAESHLRSGMLLARLMGGSGLLKPKDPIPGADFAGRIEAVGKDITQYQPGDAVFGRRAPGGFAEFVCVSERPIAKMPANISFEQAAAVPVAAVTALQGLRDSGKMQAGQKVLINGAAGGVGTFAVQLARAFGADVTGVCSPRNLELVRSLGAGRVIDYTREDFTRGGQQYDLILDNVGNHTATDIARVLAPQGICVGIGFTSIGMMARNMLLNRLVSKKGGKQIVSMLARVNPEDLTLLKTMIEAGQVTPVVDRTYTLDQVPEAYRYLESKHASGKIVITFAETEPSPG